MKCKKCKSEEIYVDFAPVFDEHMKYSTAKIDYICKKCGNRGKYHEVVDTEDKEFENLLEEM